MHTVVMKTLGSECKSWRVKMGYRLKDIAFPLNYSKGNIVAFENGLNNNAVILLAYMQKGFRPRESTLAKLMQEEANG